MTAPLIAGILVGGGLYYVSRVVPRIAQRAAMTRGASEAFANAHPYFRYECGFQKSMSEREAYLLLGFAENEAGALLHRPSEDDVKARYRSLMKELHSDVSGTPYIATKLNEAKDLLTR